MFFENKIFKICKKSVCMYQKLNKVRADLQSLWIFNLEDTSGDIGLWPSTLVARAKLKGHQDECTSLLDYVRATTRSWSGPNLAKGLYVLRRSR